MVTTLVTSMTYFTLKICGQPTDNNDLVGRNSDFTPPQKKKEKNMSVDYHPHSLCGQGQN